VRILQPYSDGLVMMHWWTHCLWKPFIILIMQPINAVAFVYDGIFKGGARRALILQSAPYCYLAIFISVLVVFDYFGFELRAIWLVLCVWMIGRALLHLEV
jgi:Na+-driven multidrug efflux pump